MSRTEKPFIVKNSNDLSLEIKTAMVSLLQPYLAGAIDLQSHLKQAHWTVKGLQFISLHELFDKLAGEADEQADLLAERIAQLGGQPRGTVKAVAGETTLPEYPLNISAGAEQLAAVAKSLAAFGAGVRAGIDVAARAGDADTADVLTEISRACDKNLWFIESHLQ